MVLLTMEYKLVTVPYFMDEMQFYELGILMDNLNVGVKNDWIIAREIMWSNLKPWSKGNLKPDGVMTFPWEKGGNKKQLAPELNKDIIENMKHQEEITKQRLMSIGVI